MKQKRAGFIYPIHCANCGREFPPSDFSAQQLEVIDLWSWLLPLEKEKSLLLRAMRMFERHPEARGLVQSKLEAILHRPVRDPAVFNMPFSSIRDPRPADYGQKLRDWTEGDPELLEFLEQSFCDYGIRFRAISEDADKWEAVLHGRIVLCPACGSGVVTLADRAE